MPATIILKNIPGDVYARLKLSAKTHRRSLNSETIACLEAEHYPKKPMKPWFTNGFTASMFSLFKQTA